MSLDTLGICGSCVSFVMSCEIGLDSVHRMDTFGVHVDQVYYVSVISPRQCCDLDALAVGGSCVRFVMLIGIDLYCLHGVSSLGTDVRGSSKFWVVSLPSA